MNLQSTKNVWHFSLVMIKALILYQIVSYYPKAFLLADKQLFYFFIIYFVFCW